MPCWILRIPQTKMAVPNVVRGFCVFESSHFENSHLIYLLQNTIRSTCMHAPHTNMRRLRPRATIFDEPNNESIHHVMWTSLRRINDRQIFRQQRLFCKSRRTAARRWQWWQIYRALATERAANGYVEIDGPKRVYSSVCICNVYSYLTEWEKGLKCA